MNIKRQQLLKEASYYIKKAEMRKQGGGFSEGAKYIGKGLKWLGRTIKGKTSETTRPSYEELQKAFSKDPIPPVSQPQSLLGPAPTTMDEVAARAWRTGRTRVPKNTGYEFKASERVPDVRKNGLYKSLNDQDRSFFDAWLDSIGDIYAHGNDSDMYGYGPHGVGLDRRMMDGLLNDGIARMQQRFRELPSDSYFKRPDVKPFDTPEMEKAYRDLGLRMRYDYGVHSQRRFRSRPDFLTGNEYVSPEEMRRMDKDWTDFVDQFKDVGERFKPLGKNESFYDRWNSGDYFNPGNEYTNRYPQFWYPSEWQDLYK